MRHLLQKNLLFFTSSSSSFQPRSLLLLRFHLCEFSSSTAPSYSHWKRLDDESRNVRVSVWWDFENCSVPVGLNVSRVAPSITDAVRANGIKGPVHITAFGDVMQLSKSNQESLAFTGIHLTHIPNGGKNSADRSLLIDLMYWVSQNPPPAHLFLISGDGDFAGILHRLRMNNYNILLAIPGKAPDVLRSAATIMWQWTSLLKGENLTGKHFNHPPDGQFGSWYGNSKVPLENPFSATGQSTSSQNVQIVEINEPSSDLKLAEGVPKSVIRQVKDILSSHPDGISAIDLRAELAKRGVILGRSMFGYRRLSRFLSSIPDVHLQNLGDGNFCVCLIPSESPEPSEKSIVPSTTYAVKNEEKDYTTTPKLHGEDKELDGDKHRTSSMSSSHERIVEDDSKSFQSFPSQEKPIGEDVSHKSWGYTTIPKLHSEDKDTDKDGHKTPSMSSLHEKTIKDDSKSFLSTPSQGKPIEEDVPCKSSGRSEKVEDVSNVQLSESQLSPKDNDGSKTETGSFKVRSNKFSEDKIVRSEDANPKVLEKYTASRDPSAGIDNTMVESNDRANCEFGKSIARNKHVNQPRKKVDDHSPYSSAAEDSPVDKRPDGRAETYSERSTLFSWIKSWWPFSKSNVKADNLTAHQNKVGSNFEDPRLTELDQTTGNVEERKPLESHQDVSHSGKPEDSKLSELDQTASDLEEAKPLEPHHQDISRSGKPKDSKFSELDQTASNLEEAKPLEPHQDAGHSGKPELFSLGSFWNDMESFVFTPKGSLLISQSKSREDLAHKLQKHGPMVLKSLSENYIFQLVELLVAEKRWLEESTSQAFPFRLTHSVQKSALSGHTNGANGLRSLFLSKTSQPNLQKSFEHDGEKPTQSIQRTGVSRPATEIKYTEKSRSDILQDCQRLVTDILKENPEGYNLASFRKQFAYRYGYTLDVKKLGYQKISYLIQIMHGVKLESHCSKKSKNSESTYMYPAPAVCASDSETSIFKTHAANANHEFNSDDELSDTASKEDNMESPWEELGPVSAKKPSQNDLESNSTLKAIEMDTPKHPDYEPIVSDDDSSESDEDSSCLTQPEELGKPKYDEQDSSLIQTLDIFHSSKEGANSCDDLLNMLDSSINSKQGFVSKNTSGNHREKQRSQRYCFVDDPALPDNDKCIGGLPGNSKKEDSANMQN